MTDAFSKANLGNLATIVGQEGGAKKYRIVDVDDQGRIILSPGSIVNIASAIDLVSGDDRIVTAAGTAEELSIVSIPCLCVIVQALFTNTGVIYVGGPTCSSTNCIQELNPGESVTLDIDDPKEVWLDSAVNGEGAHWGYLA